MMTVPPKLKQGDEIRIIAPARSLSLLSDDLVTLSDKNSLSVWKVVEEKNSLPTT